MAFNYRPKSAQEISKRGKVHSSKCSQIWTHIKDKYGETIVLDKSGNDSKIKIPRVVMESKATIATIKSDLKKANVDLKGMDISFGNGSGKGGAKMDAATTAMQENATRYCCEKYKGGKIPPISEIAKIYPAVKEDESWVTTFEMQAKLITAYMGAGNIKYSRDVGIMPIVENAAKRCGVRVKDNWNPADIYAVKSTEETEIKDKVNAIADSTSTDSEKLDRLNEYMRGLFVGKSLVGISLKKLGKTIRKEETNVTRRAQKQGISIKPRSIKLLLDMNSQNEFVDGEFTMALLVNGKTVNVQIRAFSGLPRESTQMDMTASGAAAKLGKVSSIIAIDPFLAKYSLKRRMGTKIPKVGKWTDAQKKEYVDEYNEIKNIKIGGESINFGKDNWPETLNKAIEIEQNNPRTASQLCAKLQCFQWVKIFNKISKAGDLDEFLTVLYYGAKKQYATAGPFLKLS